MISKPIPYGRQHITDEDIRAVIDTLKSDYLTQGPKIREFETKFAEYVGAQYAVAVNNATSGLHLAATALNVKPGDKVIVTPMTFAASANCIRYCGGEVVFCDIDKLLPAVLTKVLFRLILQAILWIWKSSESLPTSTACGLSRMPVMLPVAISWTVKARNNIVATVVLPTVPYSLSIP